MPAPRRALTLAAAREVLSACCAPLPGSRHGVEVEWLTWPVADPAARPDAAALDRVVHAAGPGASGGRLTLEPGGQVELSTAPRTSLAATAADLAAGTAAIADALAGEGLRAVGLGLDPVRGPRRVVDLPRYAAMEAYFDAASPLGRRMMCNTASVQVNVACGPDPLRTWRLAHDVGPVLAAAFANSPLADGVPTGWRSARLAVWAGLDPSRSAPVPVTDDPAADWAAYALAARVMLVRAAAGTVAVEPAMTLADWVEHGSPYGWPTADDVRYHTTTLFPPVRPRGWLELRMVDGLPDRWALVPLAVALAVLSDHEAGARTAAATAVLGPDAWTDAARSGLADPVLRGVAAEVFAAALAALPRLGAPPGVAATVAAYAETYVAEGRSPADDRLADWSRSSLLLPPAEAEPSWT